MRRFVAVLPSLLNGADRVSPFAGLAVLAAVSVAAFLHPIGYAGWHDQSRYVDAARAFAAGVLSPARHHYPPGYALMAAPFAALGMERPFAVPDALCLGAFFLVFLDVSRRLTPERAGWRTISAAAFLLGTLGTPYARSVWTVPWNTTAAAPAALAAIGFALRLRNGAPPREAGLAGLALGVLAGIRPADAAVLMVCLAPAVAVWGGARRLLALALFAAGIAAGALPFLALQGAIHGFGGGAYVGKSAAIGFDWRLLPLRWVLIVLDPRPLLPEGLGLAEGLPWIGPGLAGLFYLLLRREGGWALLFAAVALHWALYLAYRDLHPYGIWRFHNLHYFKWSFPVLALAACRLLAAFGRAETRLPAIAASCAALAALAWVPRPVFAGQTELADGMLQTNLSGPGRLAFLPAPSEAWRDLYFSGATLSNGQDVWRNTRDFKLLPVPGGVLIEPLRRLPPPPLALAYPGVSQADPDTLHPAHETCAVAESACGGGPGALGRGPALSVIVRLAPGLPCGIFPHRLACGWRVPAR